MGALSLLGAHYRWLEILQDSLQSVKKKREPWTGTSFPSPGGLVGHCEHTSLLEEVLGPVSSYR